jgi:hypothetical protein
MIPANTHICTFSGVAELRCNKNLSEARKSMQDGKPAMKLSN